jgi:hypothetical protein
LGRCLPCSQTPFPGHSLQKYPRSAFPCGHNGPRGPFASPERGRLPRLFGMASCLRAERCGLVDRSAAREDLKRKGAFLGPIQPRRRDVSRLPGESLVERGKTRFHRMTKRSSRSIFALLR